jgi:hypothetical protein
MKKVNGIIDMENIYEHLSIKDEQNPFSLVNICPAVISETIHVIPEEYFDLSEKELEAKAQAKELEKKLRTSFWLEYARAVRTNSKMLAANIHAGICPTTQFRNFCANSFKLLYMITPRPDLNVELEDLLFIATDEMRLILGHPNINSDGKIDHKLLALKINLWDKLANRRRPPPASKLEVESKHLHALIPAKEIPQDMKSIEARIAELESQGPPQPPMIEAVYGEHKENTQGDAEG